MSESGIFDILINEFLKIFHVLESRMDTVAHLNEFLQELGWDVNLDIPDEDIDFSDLFGLIPDLNTKLNAFLDTNNDIEKILNLIELISALYSAMQAILNLTSAFENLNLGNIDFAELIRQVRDYAIIEYLRTGYPWLHALFRIIGVVNIEDVNPAGGRLRYLRRVFEFDHLGEFLSDPNGRFQALFQWGTTDLDHQFILDFLEDVFLDLGLPAGQYIPNQTMAEILLEQEDISYSDIGNELRVTIYEEADPELGYLQLGFILLPLPHDPLVLPGIAFIPFLKGDADISIPFSSNFQLKLQGGIDVQLAIKVRPGSIEVPSGIFESRTQLSGSVEMKAILGRIQPETIILLGSLKGNYLKIEDIALTLGFFSDLGETNEFYIEVDLLGFGFRLGTSEGDGFIQKILPGGSIEPNFDLTLGWSPSRNVYFRGSGALEITIPINRSLGPIELKTISISINIDNPNLSLSLITSVAGKLGPISFNVEGIGIRLPISISPFELQMPCFVPPTRVGISIDTSGFKGGGYLEFDQANERYAGILQLTFSEISLVAIGLITTRMPDGSKGFSMLGLINITFDPAISLPYNFKLLGVGGLLGIQRTMKLDVIRDGLKQGILDSVMFPEGDLIARAPQIISDLRNVFPPSSGRYVIGLMAKLSWNELVFADLGIFLEVPKPIKIAILGQIYTYLPNQESPIVEIHLDVMGVLDLEQKKLYFMASIYNSRILIIDLSGDAYIGFSWGSRPYFVLSLGGFHPKDKSVPSDVPKLRRLTLSIGSGNNPRITLQTYLGLTTNTLGFGTKLELLMKAGPFKVEGYMGFDVLFIFSPFSFEAEFGAGVAVKRGSSTIMSIDLDLLLSGPTPWHAKGKAKFKILFVTIKVKVSATWGSKKKATLPSVDPWPDLKTALDSVRSWSAVLPSGAQNPVSIYVEDSAALIIMSPIGELEIRQNVVPLGIKITKYKNATPSGGEPTFNFGSVRIGPTGVAPVNELGVEDTLDYFALAQYQKLKDKDKLSKPGYEKLKSGKRCLTSDIDYSAYIPYTLEYETEIIDENKMARSIGRTQSRWIFGRNLLKRGMAGLAPIYNMGAMKYRNTAAVPVGRINDEGFAIVNSCDATRFNEIPLNQNSTFIEVEQTFENYLDDHPERSGQLQIVPECEVVT
ncbi:hypothetical protein LCGC14_0603760 [marine sediment metagenome]|uniref:DUF6603 domain-containing protein n=1 Tax=marine sediment metagenome TaxID=412755 RepID=A0A0F9REL9_9ZZZZ|nr:hypothetical protein [bacterium]